MSFLVCAYMIHSLVASNVRGVVNGVCPTTHILIDVAKAESTSIPVTLPSTATQHWSNCTHLHYPVRTQTILVKHWFPSLCLSDSYCRISTQTSALRSRAYPQAVFLINADSWPDCALNFKSSHFTSWVTLPAKIHYLLVICEVINNGVYSSMCIHWQY